MDTNPAFFPKQCKVAQIGTADEFFAERAKGATGESLRQMLDRVPDRDPDPGDELP